MNYEDEIKKLREKQLEQEKKEWGKFIEELKNSNFIERMTNLKDNVIFFDGFDKFNYRGRYIYFYVKNIDFEYYSNTSKHLKLILKGETISILKGKLKQISFVNEEIFEFNLDKYIFDRYFNTYEIDGSLLFNQGSLNQHFINLKNGFLGLHKKYNLNGNNTISNKTINFATEIEKKLNELKMNKKYLREMFKN